MAAPMPRAAPVTMATLLLKGIELNLRHQLTFLSRENSNDAVIEDGSEAASVFQRSSYAIPFHLACSWAAPPYFSFSRSMNCLQAGCCFPRPWPEAEIDGPPG